jgi:hypothetical protein
VVAFAGVPNAARGEGTGFAGVAAVLRLCGLHGTQKVGDRFDCSQCRLRQTQIKSLLNARQKLDAGETIEPEITFEVAIQADPGGLRVGVMQLGM